MTSAGNASRPTVLIARPDTISGWSEVEVEGRHFRRLPVKTAWLGPGDDLPGVLQRSCPQQRPGDTVAISEKVVVLLTFRTVAVAGIHVGPLTRLLARSVHPRAGSRGLSVPEKMQYVVDQVGRSRVCAAAAASAVTRPLGVKGIFYRIAGSVARDVDGGRPPYEDRLFPPLPASEAAMMCADLEKLLGLGVAIVDLNDYGGSVRATSPNAIAATTLGKVLSDNPLGQRLTGTPLVLVRPWSEPPAPIE